MGLYNRYEFRAYSCQMSRIYNYLRKYLYKILEEVDLPECHPTLNTSILLLINGRKLPKGHPSIEDILKEQLGCEDKN